jgi:chromate transporter
MAYTVFGINKQGWGGGLTLGWDKLLVVLVAFGLLTFTKVNPAFIILAAAMVGGVAYR